MARRQAAAKTTIPDSSTPMAEQKGEKDVLATSESVSQTAKEDSQNGSREDIVGTVLEKVCDQDLNPAGDCPSGKQDTRPTKNTSSGATFGKRKSMGIYLVRAELAELSS